ncbi:hypothetical protein [Pilibacter termitis]|nr:hypothetical protein [Pilibacter termitis]
MPFTCSKRKFRAAQRTATQLQPLVARQIKVKRSVQEPDEKTEN